jgi:hypothetical protein
MDLFKMLKAMSEENNKNYEEETKQVDLERAWKRADLLLSTGTKLVKSTCPDISDDDAKQIVMKLHVFFAIDMML